MKKLIMALLASSFYASLSMANPGIAKIELDLDSSSLYVLQSTGSLDGKTLNAGIAIGGNGTAALSFPFAPQPETRSGSQNFELVLSSSVTLSTISVFINNQLVECSRMAASAAAAGNKKFHLIILGSSGAIAFKGPANSGPAANTVSVVVNSGTYPIQTVSCSIN